MSVHHVLSIAAKQDVTLADNGDKLTLPIVAKVRGGRGKTGMSMMNLHLNIY